MTILSSIVGRCRLALPEIVDSPVLANRLTALLSAEAGVRRAESNPVTGRVLIFYSPDRSPQWLANLIQHRIPELLSRAATATSPTRAAPVESQQRIDLRPLLQMLSLTKDLRSRQIWTLLIAFVDRLFEAAPPAQIGAAVDVVTRRQDSFLSRFGVDSVPAQLAVLGVGSLGIWLADSGMGYLHQTSAARLAELTKLHLRTLLYDKLQSLDVGEIEDRSVGHWMKLLSADINRIAEFVETGMDPIITMLANGLIVTITFLLNSPALLLIQLLILPGLYAVSRALLGPIRERSILAIEAVDRVNANMADNLAGFSTIAVFGREAYESDRIRRRGEEALEVARRRSVVDAAFIPSIQMLVGVGFLTTLVAGGMRVLQNRLNVSVYNVMAFSSLRLLVALGGLGGTLQRYQQVSRSFERVLEFMDRPTPQRPRGGMATLTADPGDIEFDNVSFGYRPEHKVFDALSLRFPAGKTVGVVGYSGAGKTTLLKLLLRFRDVDTGAVRVGGVDIRTCDPTQFRSSFAFVPQNIYLFEGSIRDNIAWARPDSTLEEVRDAANVAQATEFIEALPASWDTLIGGGGAAPLSMGQRQRITIARAILAERPILLFDEATSGMDYETEAAVQRALRKYTEGRTTILVAHRLATVRAADHIYVLDKGAVVEQGTHDQLLASDGVYARLWRIQTGEAESDEEADARSIAADTV